MNYSKIYSDFIESRRHRTNKNELSFYTEIHHIIPKCLGGDNSKSNLVILSAREHFIAHRILTKIYPDINGLHYAVNLMRHNKGVKLTSRTIESIKENNSIAFSGKNNPMYGKPSWIRGLKTPESTKAKMREAHKNKVISEEAKINMSKARLGRFKGQDSSRYGLPNPRRGIIWDSYDLLYELWVYNERPKRFKFDKIAVEAGFPKASYRRIIENFIKKESEHVAF